MLRFGLHKRVKEFRSKHSETNICICLRKVRSNELRSHYLIHFLMVSLMFCIGKCLERRWTSLVSRWTSLKIRHCDCSQLPTSAQNLVCSQAFFFQHTFCTFSSVHVSKGVSTLEDTSYKSFCNGLWIFTCWSILCLFLLVIIHFLSDYAFQLVSRWFQKVTACVWLNVLTLFMDKPVVSDLTKLTSR